MTWLTNLQNINTSKLDINVSSYNLTDGNDIAQNLSTSAPSSWLSISGLGLFFINVFFWASKFNLAKNICVSSFICYILSVAFTLCSFSGSLYPIILFGLLFCISCIWVYNLKDNNKLLN